jgi:hypothetical protein
MTGTLTAHKCVYTTPEWCPYIRRIVTVDGEGKERNGRHAYTLLAAADDRGFRDCTEHDGSLRPGSLHEGERFRVNKPGSRELQDSHYHAADTAPNHGLPTIQCLDFLLSLPRHKSDLITSFSFTYDVTKILQDLPFAALWEFAHLGVTSWNGYLIGGIPRKYLEIWQGGKHVKIWDTFAYYQMSFAKALDSSPELFDSKQRKVIDYIARMKKERANFDRMPDDEIKEYCFSECEYHSIMFRDLAKHAEEMGLKPDRWSGPGAMAEAFYGTIRLRDYMPDGRHDTYLAGLPVDVAIQSYYGGRFETDLIGLAGDLIEDDIQSAYPAVAVELPCLKHGRFIRASKYVPGRWGFYYVGSRTSGPWAPFPFRAGSDKESRSWLNGAAKGSIAYVHGGRRWVTAHEVAIAVKYFGEDAIPVFSGWIFEPGCNHKPFANVLKLYLRRKIGNVSCPQCIISPKHFCPEHPPPSAGLSKIIKLIINSVYGKLAQAIGWKLLAASMFGADSPESYAPPRYQCYIWAAWITGGTRARVLEAAMLGGREQDCPECFTGEFSRACTEHSSVRSIATDGILTSKDIPELKVTDWELGTWERTPRPDAWLGMPGIYAFRDTGKPDSCAKCKTAGIACPDHASDKKFKRRGLDAKYFPAEHLRSTWERGEWRVYGAGEPDCHDCRKLMHGCPEHPVRAFMPLKLALTRVNALDVLGEWLPMEKRVSFRSVQHKRNFPEETDIFMPHDGTSIRLEPITVPDDLRSAPYEPKQTWEDVAAGQIDDPDIAIWDDSQDAPEMHEKDLVND